MKKNKTSTSFFYTILWCAMLFNIGCAKMVVSSPQNAKNMHPSNANTTDFLMIQAADFMNNGKFLEAAKIYQTLHRQTKNAYFLKQVALAQSQAGDIESAAKTALKYQDISKNIDDVDTNLIIAEDHVQKKQYNLAIILLEKIVSTNPTLQTHYILSNLYIKDGMPKKALQHFIAVYNDEMSIGTKLKLEALNQIVSIYLQSNDLDNALKYLNEYIIGNEFSIKLESLFAIYYNINKLDALLESLKKRFIEEQSIENARMVISVLVQMERYNEAIDFLKDYKDELGRDGAEILVQVYAENKDFKKAAQLAKQLYLETNRIDMLGLSAVYEYEATSNKNKKTLQPIINSLQNMLTMRTKELQHTDSKLTKNDAFFYNFLGYLMIEHDIDIDGGMQYVSKALAIEPTSIEYLDSLAWGFYKKGKCKEAKETFNLIDVEKIKNIPELVEHNSAIKACK